MDYKAEYNKALEAIKELLENNPSDEGIHNWVNDKFPGLLESKDEKIRKLLIKLFMSHNPNKKFDNISTDEIIEWLEKQDKNSQVMCPTFTFDDVLALQCCMEIVKKVQEDKELYEQLQSLHNRLHDAYWVEKQNDQKPQGKSFIELWKDMRLEVYQQASGNRHEPNYSDDTTKMFSLNDIDEIFEKIAETNERNFTDKNSPKFHEGEWIVQENVGVYKVIEVCESWYEVVDNKDKHYSIGFDKENMCHLWTLQDAKPGDVLDANGAPFIYKKHDKDYVYFYCGFNLAGDFIVAHGIDAWNGTNKVYPITQKQSEFFFQNMKKNGYTWDSQKKELKEIDSFCQKNCKGFQETGKCYCDGECNAKKENDLARCENIFKIQQISKFLNEAKKYYADVTEINECIDWLKFIQNKISTQNIKSPLWKKVDQPIYINTKDIALVQKKDQSDAFKGCLLYLDHTLDPKVDERYILLNDLL